MNKIKMMLAGLAGMIMLGGSLLCTAPVNAINVNPKENAKKAAEIFEGESEGGVDTGNLTESLKGIFNFVFSMMGIVAVIVIILGGIHFMTSTGDPGKVKKGKDTMIWGIVGLLVVIFSFAIVNFILQHIS